jgi:hypothetical protein
MRHFIIITALLLGLGGGTALVSAQTAAAPKAAKPAPEHVHPGAADAGGNGMSNMGMGHMGMGMGMGMMGMGAGMMGGGLCPMGMGSADTKVEVKNVPKGVTITFTSTDAARVARLQKMAEAMRLMHEATAP